jgi:ATP-binding cassette subfamily B protein
MATGVSPADRGSSRRFGALRPLLGYLRPYRLIAAGAGLALVIAASTVLALGAGLRHLVDEGFVSGDADLLDQAVLALLGVVALMAAATYARFSLVTWLGEQVVGDLRRDVFAHVLTLSPGFYESARTAEISSRLTVDTEIIQTVVGSSVSMALRNVLMLIGGLILLMITSPKLTLLVLLVVPLVLVPILVFGRRVRRLSRLSQDRVADLSVTVQEALSGIRTVQAFTQEIFERKRFGRDLGAVMDVARDRIRARALLTACVIFLIFGAISVILWIGGRDVLAGRISAGDLSAFVFYAAVVAGAVGALSEVMGELQRAAGAAERLFELLDTKPDIAAPPVPIALPLPARGAVRFEDVCFHYPSRVERPAVDHLDFSVEPGETLAVVGPSGAGKTTVFQLLLRFYDPQAGRILLDGVDIRTADPVEVRRRIGLVPQDPVIFAASAEDNIRYGRPDASDAEVRAAAASAHASEFIERLPEGYATQLGERGVKLSGGQRQRIAIARAILRDPALLLLDEATSALDAESERIVQAALEQLMRGRTTIVVAHRLATVVSADRLVVLDRGRVVETGSHASLVRAGGLYARLAALQFDHAHLDVLAD